MKKLINVIYLGGPTIILEVAGLRIMTDPTLDPPGTEFLNNGKPIYWKLNGPAITDVGKIDIVLLSHDQHGDNLDNGGRELLKTVSKTLTTKVGAERLGGNAIGLAPWESININEEVTVTGTPARHGPAGSEKITGDVTGFIVSAGGMEVYITGDTVFYNGIEEVAKRFHPKYVFIFAGAAKPRGPFNITMGNNDALDTAAAFPNAIIIPLHFEGWSHYTEPAEMLKQGFAAVGISDRLKILEPGKKTEL